MKTGTNLTNNRTGMKKLVKGFSLIELLVSMTVLSAIMLMFVGILDQTQRSWDLAQGRVSQFREARVAFDIITKNLAQATLNTYVEQQEVDEDVIAPTEFEVKSELNFQILYSEDLSGVTGDKPGHGLFFQAPLGVSHNPQYGQLSNLMNARGYYVVFNSDKPFRPCFVEAPERKRYRLMEYLPPAEENRVYIDHAENMDDSGGEVFEDWWEHELEKYSRPLAENIITLVFMPRKAVAEIESGGGPDEAILSKNYKYDSQFPLGDASMDPDSSLLKHQLPPLVRVTMVAIDETSALRLEEKFGDKPFFDELELPNNWMQVSDKYEDDLDSLIKGLDDTTATQSEDGMRIRYKVFSTTVAIQGAKWMTPIPSES